MTLISPIVPLEVMSSMSSPVLWIASLLLFKLIDIEMKVGNQEKAKQIAEIAQSMVPLYGLWPYNAPHRIVQKRCQAKH